LVPDEEVVFRKEAGAELVAVHGYDAKYAMYAIRLGLQGIEFLTTGRITLQVSDTADTPGLSGMGFPHGLRGGP
jgi:hypothetical protein